MIGDTCVVTGAGGFIGYQLANALASEGRRVVGIDLRFPDPHGTLGPPRFAPLVGDFRDRALMQKALEGASVVFHLASAHLQVSLPESEYWDVNVHSLPTVLRLARDAGVVRFVHTSSVSVYGNTGPEPATEATIPNPQSIYGITKWAGEKAVLDFGRENGFEVVVLRPAWVYGPGCPRTARLCRALRKRRFVMVGGGHNYRHPVYIDDMIAAFQLAAATSAASGRVLIVAGERAVTTQQLVETLCRVFGFPYPHVRLPYALGAPAAACIEWLCSLVGSEPPVSRRTLEFFTTNNVFDISDAVRILGFVPRYSLVQGLTVTREHMHTDLERTRTCAA